ncbi:fimbrial protein [Halomonas hibernica]|uniref:fimbrial protein n=1 Tax=Halomonas hibernica TaxID=2591147 RepID=UPI0015534394|nr:fimbrial protein [Halomonas hibernica]
MKQHVTLTAPATASALHVLPHSAMAVNIITFDAEVITQTCVVSIKRATGPVILLSGMPKADLDGTVGNVGGETSFNINLVGCAVGAMAETYTTRFAAVGPATSGSSSNTAASGTADIALQLLDGPNGGPLDFSNGAGTIELAAGDKTASGTYWPPWLKAQDFVGLKLGTCRNCGLSIIRLIKLTDQIKRWGFGFYSTVFRLPVYLNCIFCLRIAFSRNCQSGSLILDL